jgi:hypothetical protein
MQRQCMFSGRRQGIVQRQLHQGMGSESGRVRWLLWKPRGADATLGRCWLRGAGRVRLRAVQLLVFHQPWRLWPAWIKRARGLGDAAAWVLGRRPWRLPKQCRGIVAHLAWGSSRSPLGQCSEVLQGRL